MGSTEPKEPFVRLQLLFEEGTIEHEEYFKHFASIKKGMRCQEAIRLIGYGLIAKRMLLDQSIDIQSLAATSNKEEQMNLSAKKKKQSGEAKQKRNETVKVETEEIVETGYNLDQLNGLNTGF